MGVNWNEMNTGTPAALYTKLPINQPKVVDIAEAGVGDIQPSPPPAGTLPWAPAPQRSQETPNPYRDPALEPAKYIRLLGVKEDLQAFFGFQAFMLEPSSDPSIQIPLTRARADMAELIDIQSVMERNPGLPSRINNKQLDDIQSNLRYLREVLHDLEASGAVQQGALEGFTNMPIEGFVESYDKENVLKYYIQEYLIPMFKSFSQTVRSLNKKDNKNNKNIADNVLEKIDELNAAINATPKSDAAVVAVNKIGANYLNELMTANTISANIFPRVIAYTKDFRKSTVDQLIKQIPPYEKTVPNVLDSSTVLGSPRLLQDSSMPIEKRATKTELQEFQTKVVIEITRLQASGTTDPVINARITTLNAIKDDVDDVLTKLKTGALTPNTVPIYSSDIEKALPLLGKPTDPLPQVLKKYNLPSAIQNLFPAGLSPKDKEQAQQIDNIVKGYMKNIFEGTSWGLNVNIKYDNPTIAKLKADEAMYSAISKSQDTVKPSDGTGLPGLSGVYNYNGYNPNNTIQGSGNPDFRNTDAGYDFGIPGVSFSRILPEPVSGGLDWKERSEQIREQVRRRGLNPLDFGALPTGTVVGDDYNWRGYTKMMCMRLKATTDPGLPSSVGCPDENWEGWKA